MAGKTLIAIFAACFLLTGCNQENEDRADLVQPQGSAVSQQELEDAPDEMFSSFTVSGYTKGGKKQWDLEGRSADIMTEEINLTDVLGHVFGKEMDMTIVADEGSLNRIDNNVHLEKNVRATTEDGATLRTDYLDWDAHNQKLTSDAPVWIERGQMQASGTGMVAQPALNLVELKKDVTVKIFMEEKNGQRLAPAVPTIITCDGPLEVEYEKNLAVFYDNVRVKDGRGEIFADKMDVYFATQSDGNKQVAGMQGLGIDKVVAVGEVEIRHGDNISYSREAVYDTATGKLTLTGRPKLIIYSTKSF